MLLPEHPLDAQLRALGERADVQPRLELVWSAYEVANGTTLARPPTAEQRKAVLLWTRSLMHSDSWPDFAAKVPRLTHLLHSTIAEKASHVAQLGCAVCEGNAAAGPPYAIGFAVGVEPWAAQSNRAKVAMREAAQAELARRGHLNLPWGESLVCLTISVLTPTPTYRKRRKDVDNLVKGLLDAMQGTIYPNDHLVQCLTVRRFEYAGPSGCYFVRAMPVEAVDVDVLYDEGRPPVLLS